MLVVSNKTIFKIGFVLFTVGILFNPFTKFTRIPTYWPGAILILLNTAFFNFQLLKRKSVILTFLLFITLVFFSLCNHLQDIPPVHLKPFGIFSFVFGYLMVAIILENIIQLKNDGEYIDYDFCINVGKLAFIFFVLLSIITIISERFYPGATRNIIKTDLPFWVTTHTFGTINSLPFVMGVFIASYKGRISYLITLLVVFATCLIMSGLLTAFIYSIVLGIVGLLSRTQVKGALIITILFLLIIVTNLNLLPQFLTKTGNPFFVTKAEQLALLIDSNEKLSIIHMRDNVYYLSIKSFLLEPLFGTGTWASTGEHSYWFDRLSFVGIIGTMFFFIVLYNLYKRSLLVVSMNSIRLYKYIVFVFFILLFFNPYYFNDIFYVIYIFIPLIISIFEKDTILHHSMELNDSQK